MHRGAEGEGACDRGLALGEGLEPGARDGPEAGLGEAREESIVSGLAHHERTVEVAELFHWKAIREELEALAAPRLDQAGDEQAVEERVVLAAVLTRGATERLHIFVAGWDTHRAAARLDTLGDLAEMGGLFARELTERLDHLRHFGAEARDQAQRALGRLQLAMSVVGEQPIEVRGGGLDPRGVGRREEVQHARGGLCATEAIHLHPPRARLPGVVAPAPEGVNRCDTRTATRDGAVAQGAGRVKILCLDTSTAFGSVALVEDDRVLAEAGVHVGPKQGEVVLGLVDEVLGRAGATMSEIDLFAVGIGPGGFTSVRVGLATVKGYALVGGEPVVGLSSLQPLARSFAGPSAIAVPVLDAYKGEVFAAAYRFDGAACETLVAPLYGAPEAVGETLSDALGEVALPIVVGGPGVDGRGEALLAGLGRPAVIAPAASAHLRAALLAGDARARYEAQGADDLAALEPLYVRPSDAKLPSVPLRRHDA